METPSPLPLRTMLAAPNLISSPDIGVFRDIVQQHLPGARVEPLQPLPGRVEPRISAVGLDQMTISYVRPGAPISLDLGEVSAYYVGVVLAGSVAARCGTTEHLGCPLVATVSGPAKHMTMPRWEAGTVQLSIEMQRTAVEAELGALIGRPVVAPVDFRLAFPVDGAAGLRWAAVLSALLSSMDLEPDSARHHQHLLERSLMSGLLLNQRHSYTEELVHGPVRSVRRKDLDHVLDQIHHAPDRGYTVGQLAELAGVSVRRLQYAFQEAHQLTPMQYLRQVRLDRAHDDLVARNGTVAEISAYWGFSNPSRFARAYRERFGVSPAMTVRKLRSGG